MDVECNFVLWVASLGVGVAMLRACHSRGKVVDHVAR